MKKHPAAAALAVLAIALFVVPSVGRDSSDPIKRQEPYTISLDLEFVRKNRNPMQKVFSFLSSGPNASATGFLVGENLVMTAYHVVSGNLDATKRMALGLRRDDELEARVYTNGCRAKVLRVDVNADLALLEVCSVSRQVIALSFELNPSKDEKLTLIARPRGDRIVSRGTFYGAYPRKGIDYWSVKISARDGFSGSPVYNEKGEVVGVFSGYDWSQQLALISPGRRVQKLIEGDPADAKP